jgi:hypothetical protein
MLHKIPAHDRAKQFRQALVRCVGKNIFDRIRISGAANLVYASH